LSVCGTFLWYFAYCTLVIAESHSYYDFSLVHIRHVGECFCHLMLQFSLRFSELTLLMCEQVNGWVMRKWMSCFKAMRTHKAMSTMKVWYLLPACYHYVNSTYDGHTSINVLDQFLPFKATW